jgi:transposase
MEGLAALVKQKFQLDPFSGELFLFCNKHKNCIKVLIWEHNGFTLVMKKLAKGKFQWPKNSQEMRSLSRQEFRWLLEGLTIDQPSAHRAIPARDFY